MVGFVPVPVPILLLAGAVELAPGVVTDPVLPEAAGSDAGGDVLFVPGVPVSVVFVSHPAVATKDDNSRAANDSCK